MLKGTTLLYGVTNYSAKSSGTFLLAVHFTINIVRRLEDHHHRAQDLRPRLFLSTNKEHHQHEHLRWFRGCACDVYDAS